MMASISIIKKQVDKSDTEEIIEHFKETNYLIFESGDHLILKI